jgi:two-component system chemotaxis sensor kinase CheA
VATLDTLTALVDELVLTRNQLLRLARARGEAGPPGVAGLAAPLQRLSRITSDLQAGVMRTRLQPVGAAWNRLPRLVRDLGHELGKRIELVTTGAQTELDRHVLELIRDPLIHMVRNSADHGLEDPATRRAAGKPETGRITLAAFLEAGHVVIELADDGRGLDLARIRARAAALGLASRAELDAMPDARVGRFIFHPGFSTATRVTAVSGRGVGMDVVKTNIERLGGSIDLTTSPGQGCAFTIRIPLTLAVVAALILEVAGQRFAMPQLSVLELVRVAGGAAGPTIERLRGAPMLRLRDRLLPLVSLPVLLQLETAPAAFDAGWVVVTRVGAASLGILVDGVADTEEIVVKPMAPILRHTTLFGGSTILGDGSVIMVLDPAGIARASRIEAPAVGLPSALTPCFGCPTDRWCCCPSPTC